MRHNIYSDYGRVFEYLCIAHQDQGQEARTFAAVLSGHYAYSSVSCMHIPITNAIFPGAKKVQTNLKSVSSRVCIETLGSFSAFLLDE